MDSTGAAGVILAVYLLFVIGIYVYFALALQTIAAKTNTANGWFAWIPILNVILMLAIAQKPIWWIILLIIPLVNIIISIIVWMDIAAARNKPSWLGVLMIVPFVNLVIPAILAWTD